MISPSCGVPLVSVVIFLLPKVISLLLTSMSSLGCVENGKLYIFDCVYIVASTDERLFWIPKSSLNYFKNLQLLLN